MFHLRSLPVSLGAVACLACAGPSPTTPLVGNRADGPTYVQSLTKPTFDGPVVPIFVYTRGVPPVDRVAQLGTRGDVQRVRDYARRQVMTLRVAAEQADRVVDSLQRLPWVRAARASRFMGHITNDGLAAVAARMTGAAARRTQTLPWGVDSTDADLVHSMYGITGDGIRVAVVDGGVQCDNPDLSGRIVTYHNSLNYGSACVDILQHGTAVAGIIGATDDSYGVVGVAPEVDFVPVRVCVDDVNDPYYSYCHEDDMYDGIDWLLGQSIDVVNMSIGGCFPYDSMDVALKNVIEEAVDSGIVFVAAAGNGNDDPPCSSLSLPSPYTHIPGVIGVSALTTAFVYKSGYQYGSDIDLAAPAWVPSDFPAGSGSGTVGTFTGTSAAAPNVAGVAALALAAGHAPSNIFTRLTVDARDLGATGKDNYYGYGVVDALTAVVPAPQISAMALCSTGPLYGGTCQMTGQHSNGLPPIKWEWLVTYSNGSHSPINSGWISDSTYSFPVPTGSYGIEVKVTVREDSASALRHRKSVQHTYSYVVCPGGGGALVASEAPTRPGPTVTSPGHPGSLFDVFPRASGAGKRGHGGGGPTPHPTPQSVCP